MLFAQGGSWENCTTKCPVFKKFMLLSHLSCPIPFPLEIDLMGCYGLNCGPSKFLC